MRQKEGGGHDNFSNGPLGSRDTELLAKPPTLTLYKRENNSHAIKNAIFCRLPQRLVTFQEIRFIIMSQSFMLYFPREMGFNIMSHDPN